MATSYLSNTFKSSPYVAPIDLGLMDKVLSVQQDKFNKGVEKTQGAIDKMGMLDVMKDSDRQYLNSKINGIVESINSVGGVNFSDAAVMSQIDSMGSNVYGDGKIVNAISSTRSARNLMKTYTDFKTNPKLAKFYSQANEAYDMRKVAEWMNDEQVGSSYNGPSSATPYTPYRDNHMKIFEKVKADMNVTLNDKGLFIEKTTSKIIPPERILAAAADLLTPEERGQMKRDSWYLYNVQSPVAPETLINKSIQHYADEIRTSEYLRNQYQEQADAAVGDPAARMRYLTLANDKKKEVEEMTKALPSVQQNAIDRYTADPEEFGYQVYSKDYFRGLANRFSVKEVDRSIQADQAEMFTMKYNQDNFQFSEEMKRKDAELEIKQQDADTRAVAMGLKFFDPATGKIKTVTANTAFTSTNINTEDAEGLRTTEETLFNTINTLESEKAALAQDFLANIARENPNLGIVVQNTTRGSGVRYLLQGQEALEGQNGKPGFQMEDLSALDDPNKVQQMKAAGMTEKGMQVLKTLHDNYRAHAEGRNPSMASLPRGAAEMFEKSQMIEERIRAINAKVEGVYDQVYGSVLTPQEKETWFNHLKGIKQDAKGTYISTPSGVPIYITDAVGKGAEMINNLVSPVAGFVTSKILGSSKDRRLSPEVRAIAEKLEQNNMDKKVKNLFATIGTRDVFRVQTFTDKDPVVANQSLQNYISAELTAGRGDNGNKVDILPGSIVPEVYGMKADGTGAYYVQAKVKDKDGNASTVTVNISDDNARKIGLTRDPYANLNYSVSLNGRSGDLMVNGGNLSGMINIVKTSDDLNNYESYAQLKYFMLDETGNKIKDANGNDMAEPINIPATYGSNPSEAFQKAKKAIQDFGVKSEQLIKAGLLKKEDVYNAFKEYLLNNK